MSDLNKMSGTPWHIEKMHREEGDERRHRSRCIYYDYVEPTCKKRMLKCIGSAHCPHYKEEKTETIINNTAHNKFAGPISSRSEITTPPRDIQIYKEKLYAKSYSTLTNTILYKRNLITEKIIGDTYVLTKEFFSSPVLWERYEYLLCCLEEKIIDWRFAVGNIKSQSDIRKDGMEIIQKIYNLICKETNANEFFVHKSDFNFVNNYYYPLQSFDSIKIALEKCLYCRLNGKRPKIR